MSNYLLKKNWLNPAKIKAEMVNDLQYGVPCKSKACCKNNMSLVVLQQVTCCKTCRSIQQVTCCKTCRSLYDFHKWKSDFLYSIYSNLPNTRVLNMSLLMIISPSRKN